MNGNTGRAARERFAIIQARLYATTHAFSWSSYCKAMEAMLPAWLAEQGL